MWELVLGRCLMEYRSVPLRLEAADLTAPAVRVRFRPTVPQVHGAAEQAPAVGKQQASMC